MPLENQKLAPQLSATSAQALLYSLETKSVQDANKEQKVARVGVFLHLQRVRQLRGELLKKGFQTAKALNLKEALKARVAEISARQVFENIKRLLHSSLRTQNENNESKDRVDRRIRLLLDDIADTQTRSTTEYSNNEAVWMAYAAPQSLTQSLEAELEGASDARAMGSRNDNQYFAALNRAWDAQKNAISRQLSALGKIKFLAKVFRFINAAIIPLVSLATTILVPVSFIATIVIKTSAEILLKATEYLAIKPISEKAKSSKQFEFLETNASQDILERKKQEENLESKRRHRHQNSTDTLEDALRMTSKL